MNRISTLRQPIPESLLIFSWCSLPGLPVLPPLPLPESILSLVTAIMLSVNSLTREYLWPDMCLAWGPMMVSLYHYHYYCIVSVLTGSVHVRNCDISDNISRLRPAQLATGQAGVVVSVAGLSQCPQCCQCTGSHLWPHCHDCHITQHTHPHSSQHAKSIKIQQLCT